MRDAVKLLPLDVALFPTGSGVCRIPLGSILIVWLVGMHFGVN